MGAHAWLPRRWWPRRGTAVVTCAAKRPSADAHMKPPSERTTSPAVSADLRLERAARPHGSGQAAGRIAYRRYPCTRDARPASPRSSSRSPSGPPAALTDAGGLQAAPGAVRLAGPPGRPHQEEGGSALEGHLGPVREASAAEVALGGRAWVPTEHGCGRHAEAGR